MKILQVIHSLGYGGAEKFVIELSNELSKKQTVTVCTFKPTNKTTAFVSNLSSKVELHSFNRTKKYSFRILFRLLKLIKTQQPDIVHVHLHNSFYYIFFLSIFLKKNCSDICGLFILTIIDGKRGKRIKTISKISSKRETFSELIILDVENEEELESKLQSLPCSSPWNFIYRYFNLFFS